MRDKLGKKHRREGTRYLCRTELPLLKWSRGRWGWRKDSEMEVRSTGSTEFPQPRKSRVIALCSKGYTWFPG